MINQTKKGEKNVSKLANLRLELINCMQKLYRYFGAKKI